MNIERYEVPFNQSEQTIKGEPYTVYKTQLIVFPTTIGELVIQPASVKAFIQVGTEIKKDFFGERIRVPKHKKIFAVSKPLKIIVKELPQNEKPPFFTGAIGEFEVSLTSNANRVKVGDPIEIQIKVTGKGKLDMIEAPLLTEMEDYRKDFVIVDNLQPGDISENAILFKQIIRPKHDRIRFIPPVHFSYFNTEQELYKSIESNSVPLNVLSTRKVQKSDIINFDRNNQDDKNNLAFSGQGIQANYIFEDALENQQEQPLWYILLLLPPLFYFSLLWFTRQQLLMNQNQALLRARSAKGLKNKRLKYARQLLEDDQQKYLQALNVSISGYISDKLNLGNAELTTVEIQKLVKEHQLDETVFNNVSYSRGLYGKKPDSKHIEKILRQLSLWDKKDQRLRQLSGGMKRRVLIAKALSHEPKILFLDEPTAGVDVELRRDMWMVVDDLRKKGVTIILTTHYIEEAEAIADRVAVINQGEIIVVEDKKELIKKMGHKKLTIELQKKITEIPEDLSKYNLEISEEQMSLIYTYNVQAEKTGITDLLQDIKDTGLKLKDLKTEQSTLEKIFVNLVKENNEI